MKYRNYKPFAFLLTALLAFQPVPAHAITFVDLSDVPWSGAAGPIQRAGNLGLVVGDVKNGMHYFRPNASVSLCETAQLAYKLLLNTGKANLSDTITQKWSVVLSNYNLPTWSYDALSFCLEANIITPTELNGYMVNGNPQSATREQAARIFGRTLKYGAPAYSTTSTDTKFADNYQISDTAKSYVALLNEKGVVNGDNTNRFNPRKTLNRAETAVLVTKLYDLMAKSSSFISGTPSYLYPSTGSFVTGTTTNTNVTTGTTGTVTANTKTGKIKTLTKHYINLENDTGSYFFDTTKAPTITVDEERYSVDELVRLWSTKPILKATLTLSGSSTITKLEIEKNSKLKSSDLKGEIKSLSKSKIKVGSKTFSIDDADDITVKIDGKTEDFDELRDLYKDDDIKLKATLTLDSDDYVIKIVVTTDEDDEDDKGELTAIDYVENKDDYNGYIKVDGKRYYVEDTSDVSVKIDGTAKSFKKLYELFDELDDDEYIEVEIETDGDDYVKKIKATLEEDDDDDDKDGDEKGEITELDDDEIELDNDESYNLDDDVDVDVTDGKDTIDNLDDLIEAFEDDEKVIEVEITIKNGDVTDIEGTVVEASGILVSCSESKIKLEFDSDKKVTYEFDEDPEDIDVDFDVDDDEDVDNLEEFLDWLDDQDDYDEDELRIALKLDDDGYVTKFTVEED